MEVNADLERVPDDIDTDDCADSACCSQSSILIDLSRELKVHCHTSCTLRHLFQARPLLRPALTPNPQPPTPPTQQTNTWIRPPNATCNIWLNNVNVTNKNHTQVHFSRRTFIIESVSPSPPPQNLLKL